jgi:hypothetical protein
LIDNNNIRKLKDRNQNGTPDVASTVTAGADDSDAKDEKKALGERITELKAPTVFWNSPLFCFFFCFVFLRLDFLNLLNLSSE